MFNFDAWLRSLKRNATHIPVIVEIAETTWAATYRTILTPEQMRYMLDTIYASDDIAACYEGWFSKILTHKR